MNSTETPPQEPITEPELDSLAQQTPEATPSHSETLKASETNSAGIALQTAQRNHDHSPVEAHLDRFSMINEDVEIPKSGGVLPIEALRIIGNQKDPNSLLGDRFLRRGGGGFIVGSSGVGKSVLALQFACDLATGQKFFGMCNPNTRGVDDDRPAPLKVVYIQAENDEYEIAEVLNSLTEGFLPEQTAELKRNLLIMYNWEHVGDRFLDVLGKLAAVHAPDLVIVDPLLAYVNCSISDNRKVGEFLREKVTAIIKGDEHGAGSFGILFVHHAPKPAKNSKNNSKSTGTEMYDILGGAEVTNWARCIIKLDRHPTKPNICILSVPKRGKRARMERHKTHKLTERLHVEHAPQAVPGKPVFRWQYHDFQDEVGA